MTHERILQLILEWDAVLQRGAKNPIDLDASKELRLRLTLLKGARELARDRKEQQGYLYLAAPYSHPREEVRQYRYSTVTSVAAVLMAQGIDIYSPITHGHSVAHAGASLPQKRWLSHGKLFLIHAKAFGILQLHGWEESEGVAYEQGLATDYALPLFYIDPVRGIESSVSSIKEVIRG